MLWGWNTPKEASPRRQGSKLANSRGICGGRGRMWMHREEEKEWAGRAEHIAEQGPVGRQMWDKKMACSAESQRAPEKVRVPSEHRRYLKLVLWPW